MLTGVSEIGRSMKPALTREFQERFKYLKSKSCDCYHFRLQIKKIHFHDKVACSHAINKITNILNKNKKEHARTVGKKNLQSESVVQTGNFWDYHEVLVEKCKQNISVNTSNHDMPDELRCYLNELSIDKTNRPLKYLQCHSYSPLAKLAGRYLTIIATSVPFERLFSRTGNIINDLRNRLTRQYLQQLLFLNSYSIEKTDIFVNYV